MCISSRAAVVLAALSSVAISFASARLASAQSVQSVADRHQCSTSGVVGLSNQLAEEQSCLRPGSFVSFAPHAGITLSSSHIHAFMQASARDALHRAAAAHALTINSAFRTLADLYVLDHSGA
ncbi:MAG: hypothetical protein AB7P00_42185, partial [Sandaracinaceae bacterium]